MSVFVMRNTSFEDVRTKKTIKVVLSWSSDEPFTVTMSFTSRRQSVDWVLSRDLLSEGLLGPAGLGDVSVFPYGDGIGAVGLVLSAPSGRAEFRMSRKTLRTFLNATTREIPFGVEIDRRVERISNGC